MGALQYSSLTALAVGGLLLGICRAATLETSLGRRAPGDICAAALETTVIVGGRMFSAGGSYSFENGDTLVREAALYSVDLNQTFPVNGSLSQDDYDRIPMPSGVPFSSDNQLLFNDNTTIYVYNPNDTTSDTIWAYNVSTQSWKDMPVAGATNNPRIDEDGAWASNPASGLSYYIGTSNSTSATVAQLQEFDSSREDIRWTSISAEAPPLNNAQMVYVRSGVAGVLIAFGGTDPNSHTEFAEKDLNDYRDMSQIFVYDIASSTWFNVTATGKDIPLPRLAFCATVSAAPDDSSFSINVYGGFSLPEGTYNDYWVLSIPTFQWINVTPDSPEPYGRWEHSCAVWNDAQMIVFGGLIRLPKIYSDPVNQNGCNATHPPMLVVDTTTFELQSSFDPERQYSVPNKVYDIIGGDYRGLSTNKAPPNGFNNTKLDAIFSRTVPKSSQPTTFPALTSSATAAPGPASSGSPNGSAQPSSGSTQAALSVGAIVGIVVGVVCTLAIVAAILIFWRRRRRHQRPERTDVGDLPMLPGGETYLPSEKPGHSVVRHEADSAVRHEVGSDYRHETEGIPVAEMDASYFSEHGGGRLTVAELQANAARP